MVDLPLLIRQQVQLFRLFLRYIYVLIQVRFYIEFYVIICDDIVKAFK